MAMPWRKIVQVGTHRHTHARTHGAANTPHPHTFFSFFLHCSSVQVLYGFEYTFNLTEENAYFFVVPTRVS